MNWTAEACSAVQTVAMPIMADRLRPESVVMYLAASVTTRISWPGLEARSECLMPCSSDAIRYWSRRMRCRSDPSPM